MSCGVAFQVIARRYLGDLSAKHEATCKGDPRALHEMRIALTHLRTAILFFSPMLGDGERTKLRHELKWLNAQLGAVRDLDVAIERLPVITKETSLPATGYEVWYEKATAAHGDLARVLRSARYKRLIRATAEWIENGSWSNKGGKHAKRRSSATMKYSADKLTRWKQKLLKKRRRLFKMGARKRHRLRLLNKKLTYSIDFFEELFSEEGFSGIEAGLKPLRKAQKSLGLLNDNANAYSIAGRLKPNSPQPVLNYLSPKRKKRLLRKAAQAYRRLAALK